MQNSEHGILAASWARPMHLRGKHPRCENWPSELEQQKERTKNKHKKTKNKQNKRIKTKQH
jgi:hypothetical protein